MAFHLTRFLNGSHGRDLEPGGILNLGSLNSSLYKGDIEYQNIDGAARYWTIQLGSKSLLPSAGWPLTVTGLSDSRMTHYCLNHSRHSAGRIARVIFK